MKYELTQDQFDRLKEASKPVPMIALQCGTPPSAQDNANRVWRQVAQEHNCRFETIQPSPADGPRFFRAEPLP